MKGEELLRAGARVKFVYLGKRGIPVRESKRVIVKSHTSSASEVRVLDSENRVHVLREWDAQLCAAPVMIIEAGKDDEKAQQAQKPESDTDSASIDDQVYTYIDELLSREFSAEKFATELKGLSRRATRILEIEKTVLKMGVQRLPAERREAVEHALRSAGADPDKTQHEADAEIQAPRAGRAGPAS